MKSADIFVKTLENFEKPQKHLNTTPKYIKNGRERRVNQNTL